MLENTDVTYSVGDILFFKRFYESQSFFAQEKIQKLVERGQLEILHGGFVSNDEACTNYSDVLRNFEAGHDFVRHEFNITPTVSWQLDPFGHSSGLASLFAEIGFEATFFARMNNEEKANRILERDLEFVWRPKFSNGPADGDDDAQPE